MSRTIQLSRGNRIQGLFPASANLLNAVGRRRLPPGRADTVCPGHHRRPTQIASSRASTCRMEIEGEYGLRERKGPNYAEFVIDKMKKISRKKPAVSHLLRLCLHPYSQQVQGITKQGTALTGRNTTGPPSRAAPWWITLHMRRRGYVTDDDDDRRRRTKQYWPPYTMCRRASK